MAAIPMPDGNACGVTYAGWFDTSILLLEVGELMAKA